MTKDMDEIVQYFVVNSEIDISKGKLAVQIAHASTMIIMDICLFKNTKKNMDLLWNWYSNYNQKKIILRGKLKDLIKLRDKCRFYCVVDKGYNELPPETFTCVGLPPMKRSEAQKYVKRLQLYKGD